MSATVALLFRLLSGWLWRPEHLKRRQRTVAIIGDGSMTAGIAFEALNHAGSLNRDLIVVLNDNEMSISPNVGAMSAYLNRILTGSTVNRLRHDVKSVLTQIPRVGESVLQDGETGGRVF